MVQETLHQYVPIFLANINDKLLKLSCFDCGCDKRCYQKPEMRAYGGTLVEQQTRTADEPPILFYRCMKFNYSWRSYG
ncbi:MAG: hypothetical protein AABW61_02830 [Candidatus Aenigmatarchaeota archaeon]